MGNAARLGRAAWTRASRLDSSRARSKKVTQCHSQQEVDAPDLRTRVDTTSQSPIPPVDSHGRSEGHDSLNGTQRPVGVSRHESRDYSQPGVADEIWERR